MLGQVTNKNFETWKLVRRAMSSVMNLTDQLLLYSNLEKQLHGFSTQELNICWPEYLNKHALPVELLHALARLSSNNVNNYDLQTNLPCLVHYNQSKIDQADSPSISQSRCHSSKIAFK